MGENRTNSSSKIIYTQQSLENPSNPTLFLPTNLTSIITSLSTSIFTPILPGDMPIRRTMYEAILIGCIPIIFRQNAFGNLFPSSFNQFEQNGLRQVSSWTILVDEKKLSVGAGDNLLDQLEGIDGNCILKKQRALKRIGWSVQWSQNPVKGGSKGRNWDSDERVNKEVFGRDAFGLLLRELAVIKLGKWEKGNQIDTSSVGRGKVLGI